MTKIRKCVIPAAGFGTRLLPATKSQPKEMIPVGRKPVIQFVAEEAARAGIKEILIITGAKKRSIEDHFDTDTELNTFLKNKGKEEYIKEINLYDKLGVQFFFTRQAKPVGLANAIGLAEKFVNEENFVVSLGDTIIKSKNYDEKNFLKNMIDLHTKTNASSIIAVEKVPMEQVSRYGVIKAEIIQEGVYKILELIEKPPIEKAPSNLAIAGRYTFSPEIFDAIKATPVGIGGEFQLTDSISILLKKNKEILAIELAENFIRYDIGNFFAYATAFVDICLADEEIGEQFLKFLRKKVNLD
ncbi:MAG: UTP--glucose-1-phosphate uridylyltransferase [Candidatus Helarchaeota archaeon]|nr:UTP--glucose-1-phosphate uridylyltransferase [Candidatus Helarchaeota archaeon]